MKSKWRYPRWYHYIQPEAHGFRKQTILCFHSLQICNKNNVCKRNGLTHNLFRLDSFATYAYSCRICLSGFFIVFRLKNNKNFQQANATAVRVCLQMNPPLEFYLGVRTCELFLCFSSFVFLGSIVMTSLLTLFYVNCEFYRFLHSGWATFYLLCRKVSSWVLWNSQQAGKTKTLRM